MNDPDHGHGPSVSGGQGTGGQARPKRSRRRKGKEKRAQNPSSASLTPSKESGRSGLETRPQDSAHDGDAVRKRKRRRRGKGGASQQQQNAAQAERPDIPSQERPGTGRSARKKAHRQRSLQGRPLKAPEKAVEFVPRAQKAADAAGVNGAGGRGPLGHGPVGQGSVGQGAAGQGAAGQGTAGQGPAGQRTGGSADGQGGFGKTGVAGGGRQAGGRERAWAGAAGSRGETPVNDAPLYAALDLGTNNCRLLIAQPTRPGQFRVVDAFSRIVRLGEGLAATGRLSQEAMDRSIEALRICATKLKSRDIRRVRLIATEACRQAENGEAFLARVKVETGLELEIINRETEARLAVSGCSSLVGREAKSVVLFDIGGGSSEIAVIRIDENRSNRLANHITHWTSLPVGVVTLSERHGGRDVTPESFAAMVHEVEGMLAGFDCPSHGDREAPEDFHLIGTSGTVTTLAGVHLDLPRYDRRQVDGVWLMDAEVSAMQARLLSWDFSTRAANPCIGPDRADLVLAGCAILEAIRNRWPSTRMRVADRGLREGLLTDMMADDGVWRRGRHRRQNRSGFRLPGRPEGQQT